MKKSSVVYWASDDGLTNNQDMDWSILFREPESLLEKLYKNNEKTNDNNFFQCPAVKKSIKNTFVFNNPIQSYYKIQKDGSVISNSKNSIYSSIVHQPTIKNNTLFSYNLSFYFFSEEDINIRFTSPFFSQANHMRYGSLVPGSFNISSWFRSINLEFNLWEGVDEFNIEEDEPIAYFNFDSENKVILKRFKMNESLTKIAKTCSNGSYWETRVSLLKRYKRFKDTKTNLFILKEIKENIINE